MTDAISPVLLDAFAFSYLVGIDSGSEVCCMTVLTTSKQIVIKPTMVAHTAPGFVQLQERLERLGVAADRMVVGVEAPSRDGENLFHFLQHCGSALCLLHPRQTQEFAKQRGLRANTERLDATTIARVLLSGEARVGSVPDGQITNSRELVRLHPQRSDDLTRAKNEIRVLVVVLFPECSQV